MQIPLQLGGGLRTARDVTLVLELGVRWAIMGTSALRHRDVMIPSRGVAYFAGSAYSASNFSVGSDEMLVTLAE